MFRIPKAAEAEPTIKARLTLDKADVVLGETVRLEDTIAAMPAVKVSRIYSQVVRIGRYDPKAGSLVNRQSKSIEE